MTNEMLNQILTNINQLVYKNEDYAIRSIDSNIDIVNINDKECIDQNSYEFYDFILIKNHDIKSTLKYVGIILDMITDLHFYILPNFRGKGYLQASLNTSILPFLSFYDEDRKVQRLSFKESQIKEYFINQFGFKSIGDYEAEKNLASDDVKLYDCANEKKMKLSNELKNEMMQNLIDALLKIKMIRRQLDYAKGDTCDCEKLYLNEVFGELKDHIFDDKKVKE